MSDAQWDNAPAYAKWHTWDYAGRTWWSTRPQFVGSVWCYTERDDNTVPEFEWYDTTPLPADMDARTTLTQRPVADSARQRTLFREAEQLYGSLLELYFESNESFGHRRYNSYRIAEAVQRALSRLARRRDQYINAATVEMEMEPTNE